ncbi:hypothetical protein Tco_1195032 [Tanacetum coccineum]
MLGKKRDKITTLDKVVSRMRVQCLETASQLLATPSELTRYDVKSYVTVPEHNRLKETLNESANLFKGKWRILFKGICPLMQRDSYSQSQNHQNTYIDQTTSIWEALGGNTRDLDSIWEETGQDYNFTRSGFKDAHTVSRDGVTILSDTVKTYKIRRQELCDGVRMRTIDQSAGGKLHDKNAKESLALLEDLVLYDNESWNNPRDFAKPVKAISLPQYVRSTSDRHLIELKNQFQRLMEAHLAPKSSVQVQTSNLQKDQLQTVNEIGTSKPKEPAKALEDEFKDLHLNLPVLEVLAHAPMYIAMLDKYMESLKLGKNSLGDSKPFDTLADLGSCMNLIPLYLFKKLKIRLLEETDHVFGLADGTKSYPVGIVKNIEVRIGRLYLMRIAQEFLGVSLDELLGDD